MIKNLEAVAAGLAELTCLNVQLFWGFLLSIYPWPTFQSYVDLHCDLFGDVAKTAEGANSL